MSGQNVTPRQLLESAGSQELNSWEGGCAAGGDRRLCVNQRQKDSDLATFSSCPLPWSVPVGPWDSEIIGPRIMWMAAPSRGTTPFGVRAVGVENQNKLLPCKHHQEVHIPALSLPAECARRPLGR